MRNGKRSSAGWALLVLGLGSLMTGCQQRPWNVVLVTFDTTRADFLGCYGRETARTPYLDDLASDGVLFENAVASNPVTQPSHSTILTGVYPMVHGVRDNLLFHLPDERQTLAELLGDQGYRTGAAIGGFPLTREFGTAQGFDFYDDDLTADRLDHRGRPIPHQRRTWYDERTASQVNDAILPWLREDRGRPFFMWLHYWDPHEPHIAPAPYGQLFAHDPYQGEIAYADQSLGTILAEIERLGERERTLIVMTSDHGEGRREHHESTHAFLAYETTLHVPLILNVPEQGGGRRVSQRVGTVDIVPTILDLVGFDLPSELQGRSLKRLTLGPENVAGSDAQGEQGEPRRAYYSESFSPRLSHGFGELRVLYRGAFKYIHGPRPELFNLDEDPQELSNLLVAESTKEKKQADPTSPYQAALSEFLTLHAHPDAAQATYEASDETRRKLAALGYIAAGGQGPRLVEEQLSRRGAAPQDRVGDINRIGQLRRELGSGQFHLARRTAEGLVSLSPDNAYYRAQLVNALHGLGLIEDAARVVDATRTLSAANVPTFLRLAEALFGGGQHDRGIALAERLVTAEDSVEGRVVLARMCRKAKRLPAFEDHIAKAFEFDPKSRQAHLELAGHLVDEGEFERAEKVLRQLLETFPIDVEGQLAYSDVLLRTGRGSEALGSVERTLRLAPRSCDAHLEQLKIFVELGDFVRAKEGSRELRRLCRNHEIRARAAKLMENFE